MITVFSKSATSRNRLFYDGLIQTIYIELRIGTGSINPNFQMLSFCGTHKGCAKSGTTVFYNSEVKAIWEVLSAKKIVEINRVLSSAPAGLDTFDKRRNYLQSAFNMSDCQLFPLNQIKEMEDADRRRTLFS